MVFLQRSPHATMRNIDLFERDLLDACLDSSDIGLCVVGDTSTVVMLNAPFSRHFGIDEAEAVGHHCRRLTLKMGDDSGLLTWMSMAEPPGERELTVSQAGRTSVLLLKSRILTHANGERFKVISSTDITTQRRAQAAGALVQRQWQALNAGVVIVDAQSVDMPITYINPFFEQMTGYVASEVLGKNCRFLQGSNRTQKGLDEIRAAIANQRNGYAVLENVRKDGSTFHNELFISPVRDAAGKVTHFIGVQHLRMPGEDAPA
jgi:PAS domain S-box-containing protein